MAESNHNILNMNAAWAEAREMLGANASLVAAIVGIFVVLPYLAFELFVMPPVDEAMANPEIMTNPQALAALYGDMAPSFMLLGLFSIIASLAVLNLLGNASRPTVGEALLNGLKALLPAFAGYLLFSFALVIVVGLPVGLLFASQNAFLIIIGGLGFLVAAVFFSIRLILFPPAIAIGNIMNPIEAIKQSWNLTKGNFWSIFLFVFLVGIAVFVVVLVITLIFAALFSVLGESVAFYGHAIVSAVVQGVASALFMAIYAAIYRQLSGDAHSSAEVFE